MYDQYGDDLIKPDVVAPGGGRKERGRRPIEVITSSMSGWYEGYYDARYDSYGGAQGTSQAAPLVSGLVALLREEGLAVTICCASRKSKKALRAEVVTVSVPPERP